MKLIFRQLVRDHKGILILIVLMSVFRSAVADWNTVPTGSMKPTILEGDRILVNKMAYDIRVPFTHISLMHLSDPARGDIIIFDSKRSDNRLVKRVIGLPGDTVEMNNNILKINGNIIEYDVFSESSEGMDKIENLLGVTHLVRTRLEDGSYLSTFGPVSVPNEHYLVLGDNRDNSADSRVIGFVPRNEIVGRSRTVVMSLNYDNYYMPRTDRFFHDL